MFPQMQHGIAIVTYEGQLVHLSPSLERLHLLTKQHLQQPIWRASFWLDTPSQQAELRQAIQQGAKGYTTTLVHSSAPQTPPRTYHFTLRPLITLQAPSLLLLECTELSLSHDVFAPYLVSWLPGFIHDFAESIRMVRAYAEILRDEHSQWSDSETQYLGFIQQGADRLTRVMNVMREYTRIIRTPVEQTCTVVDLNEVVLNAQERLDPHFTDNVTITSQPLPKVTADARLITLMFEHLLHNALQYQTTSGPKHVNINVTIKESSFNIRIHDSGIPIASEDTRKIFQPFTRLIKHAPDTHNPNLPPSVGMGLTLCQAIMHQHNGDIWCEADPKAFCLTFPKTS